MRRSTPPLLSLAVWLAAFSPSGAEARVLLSADEALTLAFPDCTVERTTIYLTAAELQTAREQAGTEPSSAVVHPYRARRAGEAPAPCGTAYFESHRVRTLAETVMVAIDPEGQIVRVEVLSFDEPLDYLPRDEWYAQFAGRALAPETELGRAIRPVTGATLTARATTDAARRALALHRLIAARAAQPKAPP